MKVCKGCGAFFETKCPYCGYTGETAKVFSDETEFATLSIIGNNNDVHILYGDIDRYIVKIIGNNQDQKMQAKYVNIDIKGNNNDVRVDKKIKYFVNIMGNNNDVR